MSYEYVTLYGKKKNFANMVELKMWRWDMKQDCLGGPTGPPNISVRDTDEKTLTPILKG
jgi:hypothetical protein